MKMTMSCHGQRDHSGEVRYSLMGCNMSEYGYTFLGEVEVEFEVPATDMTAAEIASLEALKAKVVEETRSKLNAIDERLGKLRCLTHMEN